MELSPAQRKLAFALIVNFWLALAFLLFAMVVWLVGGQVAPVVLWLTLALLLRRALAADVDRLADPALTSAPA